MINRIYYIVLGTKTKLQYKSILRTQTSRHFTGQNVYQWVFTFFVVRKRVVSLRVKNCILCANEYHRIIPTQWAETPAFICVIIIISCISYRLIVDVGNKHGMMYNKINNNSYC